jgi:fructose-1-phosphate kinase PfkB-like protein
VILTLTPNPTIDRVLFVRGFCWCAAVRAERETVTPSGKGVDASLVVHELGGTTVALGLNAGLAGQIHESLLGQWGVPCEFVHALGETRTATVLVDLVARQQSTISASTLVATAEHLDRLLALLERYAGQAWGLICAGSLPPGLPPDAYARLLRSARQRELVTLLDTSGEALRQGVAGLPHVLKINQDELAFLDAASAAGWGDSAGTGSPSGQQVSTMPGSATPHRDALAVDDVEALSRILSPRLGQWCSDALIVTLGEDGALAVTREGSYVVKPLDVPVVNTAGAGDALNGGLMLARSQHKSWPAALALGTAAAASVVMNDGTAVCKREQVEEWTSKVQVRKIEQAGQAIKEGQQDDDFARSG